MERVVSLIIVSNMILKRQLTRKNMKHLETNNFFYKNHIISFLIWILKKWMILNKNYQNKQYFWINFEKEKSKSISFH
jgi:hypothetical protein